MTAGQNWLTILFYNQHCQLFTGQASVWVVALGHLQKKMPLSPQRTLIGSVIFLLEKKLLIGPLFFGWATFWTWQPIMSQLAGKVKPLIHDSPLVFYYVACPIVPFVTKRRPHVSNQAKRGLWGIIRTTLIPTRAHITKGLKVLR